MVDVARQGGLVVLRVDLADHAENLEPGASVAINGVCLTATTVRAGHASFDLIAETRKATNLGGLRAGDTVNMERSLRVGDEVGGHVLSGHVATTCEITTVDVDDHHCLVSAIVPVPWMPYLMPKGFVALNGVSLTIARLDRAQGTMGVSLIPETLARTTFAKVAIGDVLNLEVDAQTQAAVDAVRALLPELLRNSL